jgi:hypothetical protein
MRCFGALVRGLGRALATPRILLWLWLVNLAIALPAAVWLGESIRSSVRHRLAAETLRQGFDAGWHGEYRAEAGGVERSFEPTLLGVGAFLKNLEAWLGLEIFQVSPALVALGVLYAAVWLLLLGGVLEHLVRPSPALTLDRFLADGARRFPPFARLAVLSVPLYWGIHRGSRELFPWIEALTRDVTVERTVLAAYLAGATGVALAAVLVKSVFDYAKVAMVVEQRRSALVALLRGGGFVLRHPFRVFGLVLWWALLSALALAGYAVLAPGAGVDDSAALAGAVLLGQCFLLVRFILKVGWIGGEAALYQDNQRRLPPPL